MLSVLLYLIINLNKYTSKHRVWFSDICIHLWKRCVWIKKNSPSVYNYYRCPFWQIQNIGLTTPGITVIKSIIVNPFGTVKSVGGSQKENISSRKKKTRGRKLVITKINSLPSLRIEVFLFVFGFNWQLLTEELSNFAQCPPFID